MKKNVAITILLLAVTMQVMADGKMYWRESIPPKIPYQRALILFKDRTETLVLQSKYEIPKTGKKAALGWVVPVPAVPEIASMSAESARNLFLYLSLDSGPRVTRIVSTIVGGLLLVIAGISFLMLLACLVSFVVVPFPSRFVQTRDKVIRFAVYGLIAALVMAIGIPNFVSARKTPGVEVISEQHVGIYDVQVIKAADSGELVAWLRNHEFRFEERAKTVFDAYLLRGWCFVVANINPTKEQKEYEIVSEGLAAPLILRFPHDAPIYPLALTGTGNHEAEILIYLATAAKMTCNGRLTLRSAGKMRPYPIEILSMDTKPDGFFKARDMSYPYLCKFKKFLKPSEMQTDITFIPAPDNEPYREHIVKW